MKSFPVQSRRWRLVVLFAVSLASLFADSTRAQAGDVIFTDGTFSGYTTPLVANPNSLSFTAGQILSGGNPGAAFEYTINFPGTASIFLGSTNAAFTYNPSTQGAISHIDLKLDNYFTATNIAIGFETTDWLLQQNGKFYAASTSIPVNPGVFQSTSFTGTMASDWGQVNTTTGQINGANNPDFSASGGLITFGFGNGFSLSSATSVFDLRYDNLYIDVHNASATPEPATLTMCLAAGLAYCGRRLCRSRAGKIAASVC
jgi:hypothetical protein